MSDLSEATLEEALSGRLAPTVRVEDLTEHVEGWSRDTASFTAVTGEGRRRLVVRAESDEQVAGATADHGNDIETEYRAMAAAGDVPVPVPETHLFEPDRSVLGGRFFVVEHLPGDAPVTWDPRDRRELQAAWDDPGNTLPEQFVRAAAGVHEIEPGDVPVEDVPPGEVVERELERWVGIYREDAPLEEPAVEEVIRWFRANEPGVPETTLVHGDFRVGNVLVDGDELTGVLDWELARAGDPLYDLGYASTRYFAGKLVEGVERPELACSLLEREWFYDRYEDLTGRTVDRERVRYWRAFAAFVMMTIAVSGVRRFADGTSDDVRNAWFQYVVPGLIEDQLAVVRGDRT